MSNLYTAQVCELKSLKNLFIELTAKNCNQRCRHCYIDFPLSKNVKDFISPDIIKSALADSKNENIECIYLVGAEPMTHPDFNSILRLCLKRSNVCVFTNGSFINEKKARFLKKIEDESDYEIIFQLSINHYNELMNDEVRSRGSYRQVLNAVKCLVKYGFNPIFCVTDFYKEGREKLIFEFKKVFANIGFETKDNNYKVNIFHDESLNFDFDGSWSSLDCQTGRIITAKGVYNCPFLANDHRGRSGADLSDFSRQSVLETDYCATCIKNGTSFFGINYSLF